MPRSFCPLLIALFVLAVALFPRVARAQDDPLMLVHTGQHYIWYCNQSVWQAHREDIQPYFDYDDQIFSQIVKDWKITPTRSHYYVYIVPHPGLGGFATGDIGEIHALIHQPAPGIGLNAECFYDVVHGVRGYFAYTFTAHETVNNLTGQLVTANWPRDWWADDISPFPAMTAVTAEAEIGRTDISALHGSEFVHDKLWQMFHALQQKYGWELFQRMFAQMKADHMDLTKLDYGYNPSAILTGYVSAYIVIGSGDTLQRLDGYFKPVVPGYSQQTTREVLAAWKDWKQHGGSGAEFLSGHYLSVGGHPDFALSNLQPDGFALAPGGSAAATVAVRRAQGYSGPISLSVTGLPPGVTATAASAGPGEYRITLAASDSVRATGGTLTIRGSSASLRAAAAHALTAPVLVTSGALQTPVDLAPVATLYGVAAPDAVLGDNGGIDGHGFAYACDALGATLAVNGDQFAIGPPATGAQGTYNAVTAVTVPLPPGRYRALCMLGSASNGAKEEQIFTVNYQDGSSKTYTQSLSDWTSPHSYPGENLAADMAYCAIDHGILHAQRYLYEYRITLNPGKAVKSFTMPGDSPLPGHSGVAAVALTLVR